MTGIIIIILDILSNLSFKLPNKIFRYWANVLDIGLTLDEF